MYDRKLKPWRKFIIYRYVLFRFPFYYFTYIYCCAKLLIYRQLNLLVSGCDDVGMCVEEGSGRWEMFVCESEREILGSFNTKYETWKYACCTNRKVKCVWIFYLVAVTSCFRNLQIHKTSKRLKFIMFFSLKY